MALLNFDEVARFAARPLTEGLVKSAAETSPQETNVFLSYSSKDREHVAGVLRFFEQFDATVYVDIEDTALPEVPSVVTAATLCEKIEQARRLVVLVTKTTQTSLWVPWELGVAHGKKGVSPVALLPLSPADEDQDEMWTKQHYLGLYPRIRFGPLHHRRSNATSAEWMVHDPRDKRSWPILQWLHEEIAEEPEVPMK